MDFESFSLTKERSNNFERVGGIPVVTEAVLRAAFEGPDDMRHAFHNELFEE